MSGPVVAGLTIRFTFAPTWTRLSRPFIGSQVSRPMTPSCSSNAWVTTVAPVTPPKKLQRSPLASTAAPVRPSPPAKPRTSSVTAARSGNSEAVLDVASSRPVIGAKAPTRILSGWKPAYSM